MKNIFSILIILLGFSLEIYGQVDNPPVISDISNIPAIPEEDEDLVISATITDDGGLTATDLYYVINSGETQITTMTNIVGTNMFSVTLSSSVYNKGDLFEYWIHAADNGPFAPQITESAHTDFLIGTIDIIDLHAVDENSVLTNDGMTVKIRGIATVANSVFSVSNLDVYIQDLTGGINVFQSGAVSTPITMGSDYTIIGTIDQFNGKAEIIPSDPANDITDNGTGTLPDALEMTVDALLADPETYEGMLVKIFNLDSVDGTWGGNSNITVNDGTGSMLFFIDIDTDVDESTEGTYPVDIVGIFGQYDTSSPYDDGYQIMPRFATDLTWSPSAIEPVSHAGLIKEFRLYPNFPNPFNPSTTLQFDVPKYTDHLELGIYNISGQKVKNLYAGSVKQGRFEYKWNGTNDFNQNLPSGVYFAVLKTTGFSQTIKMMLIK